MIMTDYYPAEVFVVENIRSYGCWDKRIISREPFLFESNNGKTYINDELLPCELRLINAMLEGYSLVDIIDEIFEGETVAIVWTGLSYQVLISEKYENIFKKTY